MKRSTKFLLAMLVASPLPCLAADEPAPNVAVAPAAAANKAVPAEQPPPDPRWGPGTRAELLAESRGGADQIANEATLGGTVSGNSAVNLTTGSNTIDAGSFANASGLPVVIQNSGSNVLIQNATVINLQLQ
jgi:hypothetical protein